MPTHPNPQSSADPKARWAKHSGLREIHRGAITWTRLLRSAEQRTTERDLGYLRLPGDDHCSLWGRKRMGALVWVSQPWRLSDETIADMRRFAEHFNFAFEIGPASFGWHAPGRTLFVVWWHKERPWRGEPAPAAPMPSDRPSALVIPFSGRTLPSRGHDDRTFPPDGAPWPPWGNA